MAGFSHFMEKEIFEQPEAVRKSIEGRLSKNETQEGIFGAGFEEAVKTLPIYKFCMRHQLPLSTYF